MTPKDAIQALRALPVETGQPRCPEAGWPSPEARAWVDLVLSAEDHGLLGSESRSLVTEVTALDCESALSIVPVAFEQVFYQIFYEGVIVGISIPAALRVAFGIAVFYFADLAPEISRQEFEALSGKWTDETKASYTRLRFLALQITNDRMLANAFAVWCIEHKEAAK